MLRLDHEFTQVMKGLQGERLRQAFRFFDKDGDGYIRAEEFKRVIMVSQSSARYWSELHAPCRKLLGTSSRIPSSSVCLR
jgi:hypothetical protein